MPGGEASIQVSSFLAFPLSLNSVWVSCFVRKRRVAVSGRKGRPLFLPGRRREKEREGEKTDLLSKGLKMRDLKLIKRKKKNTATLFAFAGQAAASTPNKVILPRASNAILGKTKSSALSVAAIKPNCMTVAYCKVEEGNNRGRSAKCWKGRYFFEVERVNSLSHTRTRARARALTRYPRTATQSTSSGMAFVANAAPLFCFA